MTMQESQIGRRDVLLFLHFVQLHYFHTHVQGVLTPMRAKQCRRMPSSRE